MNRVLILTASFGDDHNAAARNLCDALESLSDQVQVEVLDLFGPAERAVGSLARKACTGLLRFAPALLSGFSGLRDKSVAAEGAQRASVRLALGHFLQETSPDVVVATSSGYSALIRDLYCDHAERPFRLITVVTETGPVASSWSEAPSDLYCVPNEASAAALRAAGVPAEWIKTFGFPVSPVLSKLRQHSAPDPTADGPYRLLYLVTSNRRKLRKTFKRLLEREENHLTIVVGRNAYLKAELTDKLKRYGSRVHVLGWTNQLPHLMLAHHLVIAKADTSLVQEAVAAGCPMIANRVAPGHDEANARLLIDKDIGEVASKPRDLAECVRHIFKNDAKVWRRWRENLKKISQPDAALRIARVVLDECESHNTTATVASSVQTSSSPSPAPGSPSPINPPRQLLCDFHIHTNYSDGKLSLADVIDFYGHRRFDCICITDHLADSRRLIGKLGKLSRLTLSPNQLDEYFEVIEHERRRGWRKYNMLVMAGLEFNKDGLTSKSSAHLLGIDLTVPIIDCLDLPETIAQIHAQGGLAVASHPHIMKSEWGKNTLYLWENQERFVPLIDAWEIANRNNMFNPVSAKRLPYIASSDFHKPKHIYSWKTLVSCEKNPEAIKQCIRKNERIAITLYRENDSAVQLASTEPQSLPIRDHPDRISPLLPAA